MGAIEQPGVRAFRCNICGAANEKPLSAFGREIPSCDACGSTVRTRALVRMLAREIFGADMAVPDFPVLKSLRGVGMSDTEVFAGRLAEKFGYRNTHYDREPRLDILNPAPGDIGVYDFIVSSEVLEHVAAPVERAFENLFRMLKPNGVLLMTVPYRPEGDLQEHFGPMSSFGLAEIDGRTVLVRRSAQGGYEVLDNLVFHGGCGATLEMRVFSDASIRRCLAGAGFDARVYTEDAAEFGVIHDETWSLPIAARKGDFSFGPETRREWAEQWTRSRAELTRELARQVEHERGVAADLREKLNQRNAETQALVLDFDRRFAAASSDPRQLFEKAEAARRLEMAKANAVIEQLNREIERSQEAAQAAITRLEAELQSRTEWARASQAQADANGTELAAARERIVALEAMLRQTLFARVKRRLGIGRP